MSTTEAIQAWAAVGTWAAVLAVLFIEVARPRLRRPRLTVKEAGSSQTTVVRQADSYDQAWHRVVVANMGGSSAFDVDVRIVDFSYSMEAVVGTSHLTLDSQRGLLVGRRIRWSNTDDNTVTLPPMGEHHLDLIAQIGKPHYPAVGRTRTICCLNPAPEFSRRDEMPANRIRLTLSVSGRDLAPSQFAVDVSYDNTWIGGEKPLATIGIQAV